MRDGSTVPIVHIAEAEALPAPTDCREQQLMCHAAENVLLWLCPHRASDQGGSGHNPLFRKLFIMRHIARLCAISRAFCYGDRGCEPTRSVAWTKPRHRALVERHLHPHSAMQQHELQEILSDVAFAAELPASVLGLLAAQSRVTDYPTGAVLFREGSENDNLYLICDGAVALEMCVPARGCLRLMSLGPGDMLAWSALLGRDQPMTATAIATEPTRVVAISGARLRELCDADHEVGYQLMRRMAVALSRRLLATRLQLLDLFSTETPALRS